MRGRTKWIVIDGTNGKSYRLEYRGHKDSREDIFWIYNQDEEGMGVSEKALFEIFDVFFKERF